MNDLQQTLEKLRQALGDAAVVTGADISQRHYSDWTGHAPRLPCRTIAAAHHGAGRKRFAHLQ